MGIQPQRIIYMTWDYPPLETAIQEAGFEEMEECVLKIQNIVAQYIAARPILELFEETVRMPGTWMKKRCQEQEGLELTGARATEVAAYEERGG